VTTQTVQSVPTATMPRVNLLPPEIAEAARFRRIQLGMGAAVVAAGVVVAGLYVNAHHGVTAAQSKVDAANAQHAGLQTQLNGLQSVAATYADVQAKRTLLSQAMSQEIRWSFQLNDLSLRIPSHVWLTSVTATETSAGGTSGSSSTPTVAGGIGTITFSGVALRHDDVASWLDSLAGERGYEAPTFASSAETKIGSRTVVDFQSSVNVTSAALSHRFDLTNGAH
jgi:Tfp pilus assembly protein PilN